MHHAHSHLVVRGVRQYAIVKGHTLDLAMLVCNFVKAPPTEGDALTSELASELVRYLNLAHLLLLSSVSPHNDRCGPQLAEEPVEPHAADLERLGRSHLRPNTRRSAEVRRSRLRLFLAHVNSHTRT